MSRSGGIRLGPAAIYTLWRFAVFLVVAAVLWLLGLRSWALAFAALLLSLPVSLVVLRKQRAEFASALKERRQERLELRAKLHGDDI